MKRRNPYLDMPLTAERILSMAVCAVIYLSQLAYGTLLGLWLFAFRRKTDKRRERFHRAMYRIFRFDFNRCWLWSSKIVNPYGETFEKGAIIICNHQSMLDALCMLTLSPRILMVMSGRVWNNPFVAAVLRFADFFSVADSDWDNRLDYCRKFIDKGYSIVIFPEGQRSLTGDILRFHRGAFYLAEKLHADILPVYIHGAAHILPLGKAFASKGHLLVEIGKRMAPGGVAYAEQCRRMHRHYLRHYEEICRREETADYFHGLAVALFASIGLRREAERALAGEEDICNAADFVCALVNPQQLVELSQSSPVAKLYRKYKNLPENILFK